MKTTRTQPKYQDNTAHLTDAQKADRNIIVSKVREILLGQYAGRIVEAQNAYQWLMGWCDVKGYDFTASFEGARRNLVATACGTHDVAAYNGAFSP